MKFKLGDKVKIREDSLYYDKHPQDNPAHLVGIITIIDDRCLNMWGIRVKWPNGDNAYNPCDLMLYNGTKPRQYIKKHEL